MTESFRASARILADNSDHSTVLIHTRAGVTIPGVIIDTSENGMGVAISAHEPIAADDVVTVQSRLGRTDAVVRHITEKSFIHVGLEFMASD